MRDAAGSPIYSYGMGNHTKADSYNFDTRLDYQHRTRLKGETITLSYMLSAFRNKNKDNSRYNDLVNMPVTYYGIDQDGKENFNEHTLQLDWTRPLAEKHTLETGAKYIYRLNRSHNMIDYLGVDDDTDMRYKHVTQVGAAYVSYTFHSGPWDARAGLRYEHSFLRATYPDGQQDPYEAHLNDWVPSASLRYQFNWANSLKLSYAASINRPGISFLNPAVIETPTSRSYGNTDLGSVHYHSVSMTYMHVGPKFTFNVTPQFQFSNNGIGAVKWADGLVQVSTYANTLKTYSTTLSAFVQWMALPKTNVMFNGSIGYNYYKSNELNLKNDRISGNFFASMGFRANRCLVFHPIHHSRQPFRSVAHFFPMSILYLNSVCLNDIIKSQGFIQMQLREQDGIHLGKMTLNNVLPMVINVVFAGKVPETFHSLHTLADDSIGMVNLCDTGKTCHIFIGDARAFAVHAKIVVLIKFVVRVEARKG